MASVQISGITEIAWAFDQLEAKLARKVIRKAIRKGLKPVVRAVKQRTPVESGSLKKMVKIRAAKKKRRGVISLQVRINADNHGKFHGAFVNYGTKKIKARNFVNDGFEETKREAAAITIAEITAGIEREVGR